MKQKLDYDAGDDFKSRLGFFFCIVSSASNSGIVKGFQPFIPVPVVLRKQINSWYNKKIIKTRKLTALKELPKTPDTF